MASASSLCKSFAYLNELPESIEIEMTGPQAEPFVHTPPLVRAMTSCALGTYRVEAAQVQKYESLDRRLKLCFAEQHRIRDISLTDALHFDPSADLYDCDAEFWFDNGRWNRAGGLRFGQRLLAAHPELVRDGKSRVGL